MELWAGSGAKTCPVFGAEPEVVPALGVESLADAGLDKAELEILGESAGLLGNSDTLLLTHTHTQYSYTPRK